MSREKIQPTSFGVIGLGRFGTTLAENLARAGRDVIVLDANEAKIREARAYTDAAFVADTLDKETLTQAGIQNCDTVIICIGEKIDTCILTTLVVKQLGVRRVIAKAVSQDQGVVLEKLGAEVVYPESDMAKRLAKKLTTANVLDFLSINAELEISELRLTDKIDGLNVVQIGFRDKFRLNVIAILGKNGLSTDIHSGSVLHTDDIVIVIGKKDDVERFEHYLI